MRLVLKAFLMLLVTIGIQYVINSGVRGGPLDEAHFTVRAYLATLSGVPDTDEGLLQAASELRQRQEQRSRRLHPRLWPEPRMTAAQFDPVMEVG